MNIGSIDWLFENIFAGGGGDYPENEGPEPLNRRFNWVDPVSGQRPPKPPQEMLPGEEDFRDLEQVSPAPVHPEGAAVPIKHVEPSDREGKYSLKDLIPPEELATIDQLLDLKLRAQKASGASKAALDKEFQAHRSEFESLMKKVVDIILESDLERAFKRLHGKIDRINQEITKMFKDLPRGRRRITPAQKARIEKARIERGAGKRGE